VAAIALVSTGSGRAFAYVTGTNFDAGIKIGVWQSNNNGGPALTNTGAVSLLQQTKTPLISYGVYDCFTGMTCGDSEAGGSHTGTLSESSFESQIAAIKTDFNSPALILQLPPVTNSTLGSGGNAIPGTDFCPTVSGAGVNQTSDEWGMNLALDKEIVHAVSVAGFTGPLFLESSNEADVDCATKWGFNSLSDPGISTDLGHMYAATIPALVTYAKNIKSQGVKQFSAVWPIGYIGQNGGPEWGDTCTPNVSTYGFACTEPTQWVDEFNSAVKADGATMPIIESTHSYCHSSDFGTAASGYNQGPGPGGTTQTITDNECYAYQNQWITNARTEAAKTWGSNATNNMAFAVSEWQAGSCTNDTGPGSAYSCWGYPSSGACSGGFCPTDNDANNYTAGYLNMLKGNGQIFGAGGTAYWLGVMFDDASNTEGSPQANYNVITENGTQGAQYPAFSAAACGTAC
jgi:hypothetical protein